MAERIAAQESVPKAILKHPTTRVRIRGMRRRVGHRPNQCGGNAEGNVAHFACGTAHIHGVPGENGKQYVSGILAGRKAPRIPSVAAFSMTRNLGVSIRRSMKN
jgi:hypothetical protein